MSALNNPQEGSQPAPVADGCTDPYNCKRCMTHPNHRGSMEHAGIPAHEVARATADSGAAPAAFQRALDIRTAQGWKLGGDKVPVLYTDTINGKQVCRDDLWLCTTAAFATQPAKAADSVLEDAARWQALPAFFDEYQIDAMKLYRDIDAYLDEARKQGE